MAVTVVAIAEEPAAAAALVITLALVKDGGRTRAGVTFWPLDEIFLKFQALLIEAFHIVVAL
jgi:hypothetical protein